MRLPQLDSRVVYYLLLYFFVFVLRFFKLLPLFRSPEPKVNWKHVGFGSLDLVYASAGVVALLVLNERDWVQAVMIGWAILLVVSTFLDAQGEHFSDNSRLGGHVLVASIVVVGTVIVFQIVPSSKAPILPAPVPVEYRVAIPYVDNSLDQHVGTGKLGDRRLVYIVNVKGFSAREAEAAAREDFWKTDNTRVAPFMSKRQKGPYTLSIADDPVVEPKGQR